MTLNYHFFKEEKIIVYVRNVNIARGEKLLETFLQVF